MAANPDSPVAAPGVCLPGTCTPGGVSAGRLSSCGPSTCARGPARAAPRRGRHRCNTRPSCDASRAAARNSRAGHTGHAEEGFRCVTTRRTPQWLLTPNRHCPIADARRPFVVAGRVPPPHVSRVLPPPLGGHAAAGWRANDAPNAHNRGLGSTTGSTAGRDIGVRSPCVGNVAIPTAAPRWGAGLQRASFRWYLACIPREVVTPWGRPGRMSRILLGHSTPAVSSFCGRRRWAIAVFPSRSRAVGRRRPWTRRRPRGRCDTFSRRCGCQWTRRKPGKRRTRCILPGRETEEDRPPEEDRLKKPAEEDQMKKDRLQ